MTAPPAVPRMARAAERGAGAMRALLAHGRRSAGGRCAVCRGWSAGGLCGPCERRFAVASARCDGCAAPLAVGSDGVPLAPRCVRCALTPPPWSQVVAGVDYGYPWDRLLAGFKFHDRLEHADVLLRPLLAALGDRTADAACIVPVPLARERLRERGYNQSWQLARRLGRALGVEAHADALFRVRDTGHQLGLSRGARDANLRGAFVVSPRHVARLRGARVALVDDVLTTGATARAATQALLGAGAAEVALWVVARTPA